MIKGIIFDLDGTLLRTDLDLCNAVNLMRASFNLESLPNELVKSYLGDGIRMLVERSLPSHDKSYLDKAVHLFHVFYADCFNDMSEPYKDVLETLEYLCTKDYRLSVVSNKAQTYVEQLIKSHFPSIPFDCIYGDSLIHNRKPDPQGIIEAINAMKCLKEDVVLVGDSVVDIETASNYGILICPVAWGFQPSDILFEKSNIEPIQSIKDLPQFIEMLRYN